MTPQLLQLLEKLKATDPQRISAMSDTDQLDVVKAVKRGTLTHEQAADMCVATATGQASGVSRDEWIRNLHVAFPSKRALSAHMRGFLTMFNANKAPSQQR